MAIRLEAIASRLEAVAIRLETMAIRLEAIAIRLEAIAWRPWLLGWRPSLVGHSGPGLPARASRRWRGLTPGLGCQLGPVIPLRFAGHG